MKKKIAVIGFGGMGSWHVNHAQKSDVLELAGVSLQVLHTPGHTPGSVCFLCEDSHDLVTGDTLFADNIGRCDLWGGSYSTMMDSLRRLRTLDGSLTIHPGHGDTNTLSTLPEEEFANGMAEIIKYGVIFDKDLFDKVSGGVVKSDMEDIIARCVELKRDVVAEDEFDKGSRQLLNFGHTMAHSIEKCSNFKIEHGSAVAIGMVIAAKASAKLGWSNDDCTQAIINANINNRLPVECEFSPEELADVALSDKKRAGGTINFVVPETIGRCVLRKIPVEELYRIAECK